MPLWVEIIYIAIGAALLVRGIAARSPKRPELYLGIGVLCSGSADLLWPGDNGFSTALKLVAAIAIVTGAILTASAVGAARNKAAPKDP